ncbi:DUF427 domain-containing protein [Rhodococcus phenolicus]|uniref:DUF427 domain-containing protein n=1 Tax=Rhodococcus phenolicus TaxID=263849 RepID=UPI00082FB4CA|nr:DUF427 domain-containing protein [Rhodococcus phenolicus]
MSTGTDSTRSPGFAARPDYRVDIHARRNVVRATVNGVRIAETGSSLLVDEQDHGLVFYFPRSDVLVDLAPADTPTTRCPFKGEATYWSFDGDGGEPLCWSYDDPFDQVARLRGHVAFFQDRVDVTVHQAHPAVTGR